MKKLYIILCAVLALAVSCQNNRDNNLTEAHIYIVNSGLQSCEFYDLDTEPTASVSIHRSGFFSADATVKAEISEQALLDYNEANGTDYQMMDPQHYMLTTESISIGKSERGGTIKVKFDYDAVAALEEGHKFVVPVTISSNLTITEGKELVLLSPKMLPAEIFFAPNRVETIKWNSDSASIWTKKLTISVPFVNPDDCEVVLDTSAAALAEFCEKDNAWYNLAPEEAYYITGDTVLAAGASELVVTLNVDLSALPSVYRCSIPVVLRSTSKNYAINEKNYYYLLHLQQDETYSIMDRTSWICDYSNSWHENFNNHYKMIDGDTTTFWEAAYNSSKTDCDEQGGTFRCPFEIVWNLGNVHNLVGVSLTRRANNADLYTGYVEVSEDNVNWTKVVAFDFISQFAGVDTNTIKTSSGPFEYLFGDKAGQYVKIVITKCSKVNTTCDVAALAEFNVFEYK